MAQPNASQGVRVAEAVKPGHNGALLRTVRFIDNTVVGGKQQIRWAKCSESAQHNKADPTAGLTVFCAKIERTPSGILVTPHPNDTAMPEDHEFSNAVISAAVPLREIVGVFPGTQWKRYEASDETPARFVTDDGRMTVPVSAWLELTPAQLVAKYGRKAE